MRLEQHRESTGGDLGRTGRRRVPRDGRGGDTQLACDVEELGNELYLDTAGRIFATRLLKLHIENLNRLLNRADRWSLWR